MSCANCLKVYSGPARIQPQSVSVHSSRYWEPHHSNVSALARAALVGCRTCIDIWRCFFPEKTPEEYARQPYFINPNQTHAHLYLWSCTLYRFREDGLTGKILIEFSLNSATELEDNAQICTYALHRITADGQYDWLWREYISRESQAQTHLGIRTVPLALAYEQKRWDRVDQWISRCSRHTLCQARRQSPRYWPTRLIYLPYGPLALDPYFPLVDTRKIQSEDYGHSYATLSHCWGQDKKPAYRTTDGNLERRLEVGIPERELPATFKDAISTARRLRIPYLWIDSLCIVQENDQDFARESSRMTDVYTYTALNISATAASSSQDGLNSSLEIHPRLLPAKWTGDMQPGLYLIIDLNFWKDRVSNAVINTRGWVLQERILAPCILHFCFDQLAWECCEVNASEEHIDGLPAELTSRSFLFKQMLHMQTPLQNTNSEADERSNSQISRDKVLQTWRLIISMYSRCDLTYPHKDKLVALSGIAKATQQQLNGDEYLAGLWRESLLGDLLWRVDRGRRHITGWAADGLYVKRWEWSQRAEQYRAPSWSWASVDGIIIPGQDLNISGPEENTDDGGTFSATPRAIIHHATIALQNSIYPFGQVTAGSLIIEGRLYRLRSKQRSAISGDKAFSFSLTKELFPCSIDGHLTLNHSEEVYFLPLVRMIWKYQKKPDRIQEFEDRLSTLDSDEKISSSPQTNALGPNKQISGMIFTPDFFSASDDGYVCNRIAGLMICPNNDRKCFSRVGYSDVSAKALIEIDDAARDLTLGNATQVFDPVVHLKLFSIP